MTLKERKDIWVSGWSKVTDTRVDGMNKSEWVVIKEYRVGWMEGW